MSLTARAIGVLTIPVITVPAAAGAAGAATGTTVPKPPTKTLPSALDIAPPYIGQKFCDPTAKPGVVAFAKLMTSYYGVGSASWGITRACNSGVTEHSEGRAWDWMLSVNNPNQKAIADSVTAWLSAPDAQGRPGAMARRFGIMYIIWNKHMWRAYDPARGWAPYVGDSPHTDHIHFSFTWDGAYARTSWWTGKALTTYATGPVATPSPTTPPQPPAAVYAILLVGATGPDVVLAQKVIGATPDGVFGPQTEKALQAWQAAHGLKVTGVLDLATWSAMVALKLVPPRGNVPAPATPAPTPAPKPAPTPKPAPKPAPAPAPSPTPKPSTQKKPTYTRAESPVPSRLVGAATQSPDTAYTALLSTTLRSGSRGAAVKSLQRALGGLSVDGVYGPRTVAAVQAFEKANRLRVDGVADPKVWKALEARDYPLLPYYRTVLRTGSRGTPVAALQRALGVPATGTFDARTESAVKDLQGRAKLARTGVVAMLTWEAVDADLRRR